MEYMQGVLEGSVCCGNLVLGSRGKRAEESLYLLAGRCGASVAAESCVVFPCRQQSRGGLRSTRANFMLREHCSIWSQF